jgi:MGT family glycosyltransferase
MTNFGIICPAAIGHLNPMTSLGQELKRRGHQVTVIGMPFAKMKALSAGLAYRAIAESEIPNQRTVERYTQLGKLTGLAAIKYNLSFVQQDVAIFLQETPEVIKAAKVEVLLIDQVSYEGNTVAEYLGIPYITICTGVMLNREVTIPPFFTNWHYSKAWWARLRNHIGYAVIDRIGQPIFEIVCEYRRKWKLPPISSPEETYSKLAQISPQPAELEFPRTTLPKTFHFTGPYYNWAGRESGDFHETKLTDQPLIYASMGTLQNRLLIVFQIIAEACAGLDVQLVIGLGGAGTPDSLPKLAGNPLVISYAPQLELLSKATLCITHGGMNTALESLSYGVPMIVIPMTNDQPGVAARVAWTGTGEVISINSLTVSKLLAAIERVLKQNSYQQNATRLQEAMQQAGGLQRATDIIEQVISNF